MKYFISFLVVFFVFSPVVAANKDPLDKYSSRTLISAAARNFIKEINQGINTAGKSVYATVDNAYVATCAECAQVGKKIKNAPLVKKIQKKTDDAYASVVAFSIRVQHSDRVKVAGIVAWCALTQVLANKSKN